MDGYNIGNEAIHLRESSHDNLVEGCIVRDTGVEVAKYGEGVYLGSSVEQLADPYRRKA